MAVKHIDLFDYYNRGLIAGKKIPELVEILQGISEDDAIEDDSTKGCYYLRNGGTLECIADYYQKNGKKATGSRENMFRFCQGVRKCFGDPDWRGKKSCRACHLWAINQYQSGQLERRCK